MAGFRSRVVALAAACAWPIGVAAQAKTELVLGPLVSVQPEGETGRPYLDNGLGGTEPGLFLGIARRTKGGFLLALELSTTTAMTATQSGRLVFADSGAPCGRVPSDGCGPVETKHRDTLVTGLFGKRFEKKGAAIEPKLGMSLVVGKPQQGLHEVTSASGDFAFTVGVDVAVPLNDRIELVPSFRYSYAFRGENDFYVGLGSHIFRIGLGVRFTFGR